MNAHHVVLIICSLIMYAQYACAQGAKESADTGKIQQQMEAFKALPADAQKTSLADNTEFDTDKAATRQSLISTRIELNGPPTQALPDEQLTGRARNTQSGANGQGLYVRVTNEYYSQSASVPGKQEKQDALSRFALRYSPTDNDHIWMEYRFNEKSAVRLRGAAHRGIRVLAVFQY